MEGDADRLTRAFSNLLDNAVKYNVDGGSVSVTGAWSGSTLTVTLANTGPGVPDEDLPRYIRTVLSGGEIPVPAVRRLRPGAGHRQTDRGAARRQGDLREPPRGADHGHGDPAPARARPRHAPPAHSAGRAYGFHRAMDTAGAAAVRRAGDSGASWVGEQVRDPVDPVELMRGSPDRREKKREEKRRGKEGRPGTGGFFLRDAPSARAGWIAAQSNALHVLRGRRFTFWSAKKGTQKALFR